MPPRLPKATVLPTADSPCFLPLLLLQNYSEKCETMVNRMLKWVATGLSWRGQGVAARQQQRVEALVVTCTDHSKTAVPAACTPTC